MVRYTYMAFSNTYGTAIPVREADNYLYWVKTNTREIIHRIDETRYIDPGWIEYIYYG